MYNYKFSRLNVESQRVTAWKQDPESFVRVMKSPNLPAGRAVFDQISNHVLTHFLQQIGLICRK